MKKTLKCGFFVYDVHFNFSSDEDCGSTALAEKKIFINTRFAEQVQKETLMHEILHVCLEDYPYPSEIASQKDREEHEEHLVRKISPNIVLILNDNKWVRDFIFGK